jgi:hypothetical protein
MHSPLVLLFYCRAPILLKLIAVVPFFASVLSQKFHSTKLTITVASEKCINTKKNEEERE